MKNLNESYMIHWAKFLLEAKISPMNHNFKDDIDDYFPKRIHLIYIEGLTQVVISYEIYETSLRRVVNFI